MEVKNAAINAKNYDKDFLKNCRKCIYCDKENFTVFEIFYNCQKPKNPLDDEKEEKFMHNTKNQTFVPESKNKDISKGKKREESSEEFNLRFFQTA